MDKYEFNLKLDQMKSLFAEERYHEAADLADTINWNKVKNPTVLLRAGEVYEKAGRYENSREVLLSAYERSPIGRAIIYHLAEVAIKMEDYQGAQDYYDEFVGIAPHDNMKYVLQYDIRKAQGAPYSELIPILEELKEQEYTEEWAYELAYLYHKAGNSEKCIDACDELILWFGDGPYVERALELKMLYQPLSKTQEEKYRAFRQAKDGYTHIATEELERAGELARDPVAIPPVEVNPERYNTVNLQEEIARGMQQIIDATGKEEIADSLDNINRMVEDIPYLKLPKEAAKDAPHIETDKEIDDSIRVNFQEMLGEDYDGQMSLMVKERTQVERQITGQITIAEVLEEWERTKRAAEAALQDAEQRKLESAKARALQQAGDIMNRLTDVKTKLDAGVTPRELLEEEYLQERPRQTETVSEEPPMEAIEEDERETPPEVIRETVQPEATPSEVIRETLQSEATPSEVIRETVQPEATPSEVIRETVQPEAMSSEVSEIEIEAEPVSSEAIAETVDVKPDEEIVVSGTETADIEVVSGNELQDEEKAEPIAETPKSEAPVKKPAAERNKTERWKPKTIRLPQIQEPEDLDLPEGGEEPAAIEELTEEQKKIFSYFIPVRGMESQLCQALAGVKHHLTKDSTASTGNLIIQGGQGCGKTTLATSVIRVLQQETGHPNDMIGKIHAEALNRRNVGQLLHKMAGGCLIIEQAGRLERQTIVTLSLLLEQDSSGILVILEDTSKGIKKALFQDESFAQKFTEKITVPVFNNDELVAFAKSYSKELGYEIDELAVLALYKRISNIQRTDQATTLTEVKEIVDEAIDRESRGGMKKFFSILTAKRYTDDDCIVLNEKDFE